MKIKKKLIQKAFPLKFMKISQEKILLVVFSWIWKWIYKQMVDFYVHFYLKDGILTDNDIDLLSS